MKNYRIKQRKTNAWKTGKYERARPSRTNIGTIIHTSSQQISNTYGNLDKQEHSTRRLLNRFPNFCTKVTPDKVSIVKYRLTAEG